MLASWVSWARFYYRSIDFFLMSIRFIGIHIIRCHIYMKDLVYMSIIQRPCKEAHKQPSNKIEDKLKKHWKSSSYTMKTSLQQSWNKHLMKYYLCRYTNCGQVGLKSIWWVGLKTRKHTPIYSFSVLNLR